ncbi:WecB/TagA/CpsF family glycosyltransferase [Reichenbachiella sp. MSK19-1]|uniref:WecB/TagA/CpsF family glycosyltransferase n=1 Tax=Reichenbachiella sp. MSK19-1 TaxID=1897631 RepID=UPI000E6D2718|nr:WecB/TagA/CpsF family glycosyltransferase [Reichenbachiella sp. MSK19-1]RJE71719.1 hypothetical protein BGP76_06425 [Reichenbachiella sp. MSK19-1]
MSIVSREKKVNLFDFNFDLINSENEAIEYSLSKKKRSSNLLPIIFTPNIDYLVNLNRPKYFSLKKNLQKCNYIFVDGQPIIWLSKLLSKNYLKKRLSGTDLFSLLSEKIKKRKLSTLVLCPNEEVEKKVLLDFENIQTYIPNFFNLDSKTELDAIVKEVNKVVTLYDVQVVVVGIGFPRRELITTRYFDQIKGDTHPLFCMLGAALEFHYGLKKRAPIFMQKNGMEWLHRFLSEPIRLFERYFIKSWLILPLIIKEMRK